VARSREVTANATATSASLRPALGAGSTVRLSLLVSATIQGLTVVTGVLLARELGPHSRGELAAVLLWPSILAAVGSMGLAESATFHAARSTSSPGELLGSVAALAIVQAAALGAIGLLVIPHVLGHYGSRTVQLGEGYLAVVPLNLLTLSLMGILNGRRQFGAFHTLRLLVFVALVSGLVALALFDRLRVSTVTIVYLGANLLTACTAMYLTWRSGISHVRFSSKTARRLFGFGLRSHTSSVSSVLNQRLDQLLISVFLAPVKLGLYVVATTMTSAVSLIGWSIAMVALPTIAEADGTHEREAVARRFIALTLFLSVAVTFPLLLLTPMLLGLFFGDSFRAVSTVARVLLVATVFLSVNRTLEAALQGAARPLDAGVAEFIALIATVAGLAVLLPAIGLLGAALTSLIAYGVSTAWMSRRLAAACDIPWHGFWLPQSRSLRSAGPGGEEVF
jgi:O-antigen/teichoic acid export membrane protein